MTPTTFNQKKILVCGMAKSGQSIVKLLSKLGAIVTAQDEKKEINFDITDITDITDISLDITSEENKNKITLLLGQNPDDEIIKTFDLIIISPGVPFDLPFLEKARALGIPVWGEIELAYLLCPCPIIAITGTNGKTTVTTLVGDILNSYNNKTVTLGNIGTPFTERVNSLNPDNIVVAEVSSFQLETTHDFAPKISAVLNLTPDHLDRHKTMDIYQYTKERIFAKQKPNDLSKPSNPSKPNDLNDPSNQNDYAILGYDNLITRAMKPPCDTIYFSAKEKLAEGIFLENGMICARLPKLFGGDTKIVKIVDVNKTHILPENALAATALCLCAGVPGEVIAKGLMDFKGVPHRIEYVTTIGDIEFYNDSKATNTDSAIKGLEAMKRPVVLIGGGSDKQADFTDWVQQFEQVETQKSENKVNEVNEVSKVSKVNKVKHLIVLGEVADQIIDTCNANGYKNYTKADSLKNAVNLAYKKAQAGDCILLSPACASFDMFDNFEQRGDMFKDLVTALR